MIYVCFFNYHQLDLRRIKKTILFLRQLNTKKLPGNRGVSYKNNKKIISDFWQLLLSLLPCHSSE